MALNTHHQLWESRRVQKWVKHDNQSVGGARMSSTPAVIVVFSNLGQWKEAVDGC